MGKGYFYQCRRCKNQYRVHLGCGMRFPAVYEGLLKDVQSGEYGAEMQLLSQMKEFIAIDANEYLYYCKYCGQWEVSPSMSMYAPNDPESIRNMHYGTKTVGEWGYVPYVMDYDLERSYHLIKVYHHMCPNCRRWMKQIISDEDLLFQKLKCPECGSDDVICETFLWD